jgi:hypothetical protein
MEIHFSIHPVRYDFALFGLAVFDQSDSCFSFLSLKDK